MEWQFIAQRLSIAIGNPITELAFKSKALLFVDERTIHKGQL